MKLSLLLVALVFLNAVTSSTQAILGRNNVAKNMSQSIKLNTVKRKENAMKRRCMDTKCLARKFIRYITCRRGLAEEATQKAMTSAEYSYRNAQESLVGLTEDLPEDHPMKKFQDVKVDLGTQGEVQVSDGEGRLLSMEELLSNETPSKETSEEFQLSSEEYSPEEDEMYLSSEAPEESDEVESSLSDEGYPESFEESSLSAESYPDFDDMTEEELASMSEAELRGWFRRAVRRAKRWGRRAVRRVRRWGRRAVRRAKRWGRRTWRRVRRGVRRVRRWGRRAWRRVRRGVRRAWRRVRRGVRRAWRHVRRGIRRGWAWAKQTGSKIWRAGKKLAAKAWSNIKSVAGKIWHHLKKLAKSVWNFFKCLGSLFMKGPFKFLKNIFNKTFGYAMKLWMAFYRSARSFNPKKFAASFFRKAFGGVKSLIRKVSGGVKKIMNGVRTVIRVFKKGFRKAEMQVGSPEVDEMAEEAVRGALEDEKKEEMALATLAKQEQDVGGYKFYKWGGVLSVDFGAAVSVLIQINYSGGMFACYGILGCNIKTDYGTWVALGIGVKIDISAGFGANVFLWDGAGSIPGWAGAFAMGPDMSPSECGVDFGLVHGFTPAYVTAIGFSVGCGVGINPYDIEWMAGYTWATFPRCGRYPKVDAETETEVELASEESPEDEMSISAEDEGLPEEHPEDEMSLSAEDEYTTPENDETQVAWRWRWRRRRRRRVRRYRRRRYRYRRRRYRARRYRARRYRRRRYRARRYRRRRYRRYRRRRVPSSCPKVAAAMSIGYTEAEMMY